MSSVHHYSTHTAKGEVLTSTKHLPDAFRLSVSCLGDDEDTPSDTFIVHQTGRMSHAGTTMEFNRAGALLLLAELTAALAAGPQPAELAEVGA